MKRNVSDDIIVSLYADKLSSTQIAEIVGLSSVHVRRVLKQNGIEMRDASEGKKLSHARPEVKAKLSAAHKGVPLPESAKEKLRSRVGSIHHNWVSGITTTELGYLIFTKSPANGEHAGVRLHRLIAEWKLGRQLLEGEIVHHIDGDILNNHPDNLAVMSQSEHATLHLNERYARKRA
jgi:hypothetical protein